MRESVASVTLLPRSHRYVIEPRPPPVVKSYHSSSRLRLPMLRSLAYLVLFTGLIASASEYPSLPTASPAPDFTLPGVDGQVHRLKDYAAAEILAIVFTCNSCPQSMLAEEQIEKLYRAHKDKSFALLAINPNNPAAVRLEDQQDSDNWRYVRRHEQAKTHRFRKKFQPSRLHAV
jgi:AhpC/TSA family